MVLGSGDLKRLKMSLREKSNPHGKAYDAWQREYKLPFEAKLLNFDIEEYPPKLALIESATSKFVQGEANNLYMVEEGMEVKLGDWQVTVETYLYNAAKKDSIYLPWEGFGSGTAVCLSAINLQTGDTTKGWLSAGSIKNPFEALPLDGKHSLALTKPEAKVYSSDIVIFEGGVAVDTARIEVNKPYSYKGWKLYQVGYDENMGRWSMTSVLETVFDPWLTIVYIGIFMLIAGAAYMIWIGKDK